MNTRQRLENWGRYAASIKSGRAPDDEVALVDAMKMDHAIEALSVEHSIILRQCFVLGESPEIICRALGIPTRPAMIFVDRVYAAVIALENSLE